VTYDAVANTLTFQFNNTANGSTVVAADVDGTDLTGGTVTASEVFTAFVAATESSDTYVFESTAALNGADTINNFNAANAGTDDLLDFRAFLGAAATPDATPTNFATTGKDLLVGENVAVVFNKGSLAAGDIALATGADVAGKIGLVDNGKAVVLVTADADGASDATINSYLVYYVEDTNATAGGAGNQTFTVTLVGTINSGTELNAADLFTGTDSFV